MNDKTITVYNAHKGSDGKDIWKRTVIYGVEYHYSSDRTVSQSGTVIYTPILTVIVPDTADFGTKAYMMRWNTQSSLWTK